MRHQTFNSIGDHIYNGIVYENSEFLYPNFHNSFELYYIMKGNLTAQVNASTTELYEGDLFLIAPNMAHSLFKHGDNKFFVGVFTADFIPAFSKTELRAPFIKFNLSGITLAYLQEKLFYTGTPELFELKSCLYAICSHLTNINEKSNENIPLLNTEFILKVNNYISENIKYNFSRGEIANALNYEEHYFSYLFNMNFQMNLRTYVNILRISNACNLLKHTDMSITSIVSECGFSGIRSFNSVFQKQIGTTPSQYRSTLTKITEHDVLNIKYKELKK